MNGKRWILIQYSEQIIKMMLLTQKRGSGFYFTLNGISSGKI